MHDDHGGRAGRAALRVAQAALIAAVLSAPSVARAYCRTTTGGLQPGCSIQGTECCSLGKPLFWKNACIGYSIQKDASRQVTFAQATEKIGRAFGTWTGSTCSTGPGAPGRVGIQVTDNGPVECGEVQYDTNGPNQHVIVFRDTVWDHSDSSNTLALTTMTFEPQTGEIYDADMEVNTAQQQVTVDDPIPQNGYDFLSIVTHETGHFLGLAHTPDTAATMFAHYRPGSTTLRNLTADDVDGLCDAYPADGTRTSADDAKSAADACDPTPRHGFTSACSAPGSGGTTTKSSCSAAPIERTRDVPIATAAIALAAALGLRRRRARGASCKGER